LPTIPLHPSNRSNPQPGVPPGNDFPERYAYFADTLQKASQLICFGIRNAISMASLTPERNPSGEALTFCSMNTFCEPCTLYVKTIAFQYLIHFALHLPGSFIQAQHPPLRRRNHLLPCLTCFSRDCPCLCTLPGLIPCKAAHAKPTGNNGTAGFTETPAPQRRSASIRSFNTS
jgi:hypothetical protein